MVSANHASSNSAQNNNTHHTHFNQLIRNPKQFVSEFAMQAMLCDIINIEKRTGGGGGGEAKTKFQKEKFRTKISMGRSRHMSKINSTFNASLSKPCKSFFSHYRLNRIKKKIK